MDILNEKFKEVLSHEGCVSITSWGGGEPHVTCTWNSYLAVKDGHTLLIPAAGMRSTEADVAGNPKVILTLGARGVEGFNGYQGTGFRVEGLARFETEGNDYDQMKALFPFLNRVLVVDVKSSKQLL